jgi:nitronate monooxygenase
MTYPEIIQGGMGAGVSDWRLARAVSLLGQLGVVSGTVLDLILTRRLQNGDPGGHMRRALEAFPDQGITRRILDRWFIEGGRKPDQPFKNKSMVGHKFDRQQQELLVAANFVEVFLAKEGHDGKVGINFLNKIQTPLLPSLYGAMLAGVAVVIVGAGIPVELPALLDGLSRKASVELKLQVRDTKNGTAHKVTFDPEIVSLERGVAPERPLFFPIVSSATLASRLIKQCKGGVDGLIIERASAGGHNAPPRGTMKLNTEGEPVYGPRDGIDVPAIQAFGLPFWLAGSCGTPERLEYARSVGAAGVQVGTLFAFCEESGLREDLKQGVIDRCNGGTPQVFTDPVASPTGFPFKVLSLPNTLSSAEVYKERRRMCDLGYLREAYEKKDGSLGWRCRSEEPEIYAQKGGEPEKAIGRKCLCNALMANIGLAQIRNGDVEEPPLLTCGDDLSGIRQILKTGETSYSSSDVIDYLLAARMAKGERLTSV